MKGFKTIRAYAIHLIYTVDFVDCRGRNIGYDYQAILTKIKQAFPESRTSMGALRRILDSLDGSQRLPARRRSRKILATEYARSLLLQVDSTGRGLTFQTISRKVRGKFRGLDPGVCSVHATSLLAYWMERRGEFKMPASRGS